MSSEPFAVALSPAEIERARTPPRWILSKVVLGCAVILFAIFGPRFGSPSGAVMGAILVASFASSIAGFAFSAIGGAMLFHMADDHVGIVQVMIVCSIANQAAMTWSLRRDIDWRGLSIFLLGGAIGLPLGVWALLHSDRLLYTHVLGIFLAAYGAYMLLRKPRHAVKRQHGAFDVVAGLLGGLTGGAVGFPGAFVTIWCGLKGWDKARQRAMYQPFILVMQVVGLAAISMCKWELGHGAGLEPGVLLCIPAGLFGTWLGMATFRKLSTTQFTRVVNILLIVSGVSFLV